MNEKSHEPDAVLDGKPGSGAVLAITALIAAAFLVAALMAKSAAWLAVVGGVLVVVHSAMGVWLYRNNVFESVKWKEFYVASGYVGNVALAVSLVMVALGWGAP